MEDFAFVVEWIRLEICSTDESNKSVQAKSQPDGGYYWCFKTVASRLSDFVLLASPTASFSLKMRIDKARGNKKRMAVSNYISVSKEVKKTGNIAICPADILWCLPSLGVLGLYLGYIMWYTNSSLLSIRTSSSSRMFGIPLRLQGIALRWRWSSQRLRALGSTTTGKDRTTARATDTQLSETPTAPLHSPNFPCLH